nr:TonB-dependent receptor [Saprospiraceae bacterium]
MPRWICVFCIFLHAACCLAQSPDHYFIEVAAESTCADVIEILQSEYGLVFGYSPSLVRQRSRTSGLLQGTLEDILQQCFGPELEMLRPRTDQVLLRMHTSADRALVDRALTILDKETQQPISDVFVYTNTYDQEAMSNQDGQCYLNLSETKSQSLVIDRLGYKNVEIPLSELSNFDTVLLQSAPATVPTIVVSPQLHGIPETTQTTRDFERRPEMTTLISPGVKSDLLRSVKRLAGVADFNDDQAAVAIRGSNADETLLLLDGMPIYRADHFFGIYGVINADHMHDFTLYRNDFPIEYVGKTAGLLEMNGKGKQDTTDVLINWSRLNLSGALTVPLGSQWSLTTSGRSTWRNIAESGLVDFDPSAEFRRTPLLRTAPEFSFNDLNVKINYASGSHALDFNYFRSWDRLENRFSLSYPTRFADRFITLDEALSNEEQWSNDAFSVNYHGDLSKGLLLEATVYGTSYRGEGLIETMSFEREGNRITSEVALTNNQDNNMDTWGGHVKMKKDWQEHRLTLGYSFNQYDQLISVVEDDILLLGNHTLSFSTGVFGAYQLQLDDLSLHLGMRMDYYSATSEWLPSPRLNVAYRIGQGASLKASYSHNFQFVRSLAYETRLGQTIDLLVLNNQENFPFTKSINSMLGFNLHTGPWQLDMEAYIKDVSGVAEYALLSPGFGTDGRPSNARNFNLFVGDANIRGVDITASYARPKYNAYLAYTLSKNENNFPAVLNGRS